MLSPDERILITNNDGWGGSERSSQVTNTIRLHGDGPAVTGEKDLENGYLSDELLSLNR